MVAVHTLIAEVLANLIDTLETTYDEALQIKLGSNTHVHILIECVEVGDEWAGRSTTGNALQGRSLYLCIASVVEYAAQSAQYGCTLQEGILHAIVYDEVNIALTVTQLWIVELVVSYTILVFHDWEWLQALGEQAQFLGVNRNLASLCTENETLYADEVTDVEELLEYSIIKVLVLVWTNLVAGDIDLDSSFESCNSAKLALPITRRPIIRPAITTWRGSSSSLNSALISVLNALVGNSAAGYGSMPISRNV